ncbi:MAG: ion transporter [Deltaproteobacteria bacterium]|nr:ion transporter [Deltaproteobacteria bacterium]
MITLALVPLVIEATVTLTPSQRVLLDRVDLILLGLLSLELLLRLISYNPPNLRLFRRNAAWRGAFHVLGRLRFCLRPLTLIDILALLAIYPPLRTLRALRLLRLLRGVRIFRYSRPLVGLLQAFRENTLLYASTVSMLLLTVLAAGVSLYFTERSAPDAQITTLTEGIWWALVTITTVGYGDFVPLTAVGRVIASVLMVIGMFTLALFAGIVGSTLLSIVLQLRQDQFRMTTHMNHTIVCGYDQGARLLLDALLEEHRNKEDELLIFAPGERPRDLPPDFRWISGDPTREDELDKVRLAFARSVIIVGARDQPPQAADATTILVLFTIRSYLRSKQDVTSKRKHPIYLVAEILDSENVTHAYTAGADEVIETTRLGFSLMAHAIHEHGAGAIMTSVATQGAHNLYISPYAGETITFKSLGETLRAKHRLIVLGIRLRATGGVTLSPAPDHEVSQDHEIIYLARGPVLDRSRPLH